MLRLPWLLGAGGGHRPFAGLGPDGRSVTEELMERFMLYDRPGNVRELFNELRRRSIKGELPLPTNFLTDRVYNCDEKQGLIF